MQFGLVVVSASRSRPYPGPQGAAPKGRPCGLPLGETRPWRRGRCCDDRHRRRSPRHGTVTHVGRDPQSRGSGPRAYRLKERGRRWPRTRARSRPTSAARRPNCRLDDHRSSRNNASAKTAECLDCVARKQLGLKSPQARVGSSNGMCFSCPPSTRSQSRTCCTAIGSARFRMRTVGLG